jgi:hypothetical protein
MGSSFSRNILRPLLFIGVCSSLYIKYSRFPVSSLVRDRPISIALNAATVNVDLGEDPDYDPEDPYKQAFENQPAWLNLFPKDRMKDREMLRDYPDFANLEPNDPLFLDMPWPTDAGPEASAFGKHMQWRRGLSDGESKYRQSVSSCIDPT